jgi:hypothetical protein
LAQPELQNPPQSLQWPIEAIVAFGPQQWRHALRDYVRKACDAEEIDEYEENSSLHEPCGCLGG